MNESFESVKEPFVLPDIKAERGEFERVAEKFGLDTDTLLFLAAEEGVLSPLTEEVWKNLDNTDSNTFNSGDSDAWDKIREGCEAQNPPRDWQALKITMEQGGDIEAPIIIKYDNQYHLVSGNSRLMVARALDITPKVLIFEYRHDRTDES